MNLRGSVARLQKFGARFYLKVAERFSENALVRDTWMSMARDLEQQKASLRVLPASFWTRFTTEEEALLEAIRESLAVKNGAVPNQHVVAYLHCLEAMAIVD